MNKKCRRAIIAGNWKMNMLASTAAAFTSELFALLPEKTDCEVAVCAPFPLLPALVTQSNGRISVGSQDISQHKSGAYTGEVSADQLRDIAVSCAIVGHSERRQYHAETDTVVALKAKAALGGGLRPIICVGESLEQRECGLTMELVAYQIKAALCAIGSDEIGGCVIAYEPVWAIGTGKTATAEEAEEVCAHIRSLLAGKYGEEVATGISILYGGSMNAGNAKELLSMPNIDGGLIGGASLKPVDFAKIILEASGN